jgi:putative addiction module killer protein
MISIHTTDEFDAWLVNLRDRLAIARIQARIERVEDGNFGDCAHVGGGVSELRIHYGSGYRIYFTERGPSMVILLAGGEISSQSKDIRMARQLARNLQGIS